MNLGNVKAWAAAHKPWLIGGGGVAVVALYMRHRKTAAAPAGTVGTPGYVAQPAGPATADTTAYDSYNALNDQLTSWESSVAAQLAGLTAGGNAAPTPVSTPAAPTPAPAPAAAPVLAPPPPAPAPTAAAAVIQSPGSWAAQTGQVAPPAAPSGLADFFRSLGFTVSTTQPTSGVGWQGYSDNFYILAPRPTPSTPDPLANYTNALSSIFDPYLSVAAKQQAMASIGYTGTP